MLLQRTGGLTNPAIVASSESRVGGVIAGSSVHREGARDGAGSCSGDSICGRADVNVSAVIAGQDGGAD